MIIQKAAIASRQTRLGDVGQSKMSGMMRCKQHCKRLQLLPFKDCAWLQCQREALTAL